MTSISVISPSVDKDSVPTLSTMIDPESSINNLADHAAAHQKLGTVKFILDSAFTAQYVWCTNIPQFNITKSV